MCSHPLRRRGGRLLGPLPVAAHHRRALHAHLTDLTHGDVDVVVVEHPHVHPRATRSRPTPAARDGRPRAPRRDRRRASPSRSSASPPVRRAGRTPVRRPRAPGAGPPARTARRRRRPAAARGAAVAWSPTWSSSITICVGTIQVLVTPTAARSSRMRARIEAGRPRDHLVRAACGRGQRVEPGAVRERGGVQGDVVLVIGVRSASHDAVANARLPWVSIAPLGLPVVPDV